MKRSRSCGIGLALLTAAGVSCQSAPIKYEDYRWVGGRGGSYRQWDKHLGKCLQWAETRNLTKHQNVRREHVDQCMDQHGWVRQEMGKKTE